VWWWTVFRHCHDTVFARFWKRDLDIENIDKLAAVPTKAGADGAAFGVPTFMVDGEMFWGGEHLPDIFERSAEQRV
jgi:2-hydroxychromene-2-carboxylate isomerase